MFQTKFVENQNTFYIQYPFPKIVPFMRHCGIIRYSQTGHRWQYDTKREHYMLH